ncbi:MAG: TonB family protein, partial [Pontixanthobacter sp.]
ATFKVSVGTNGKVQNCQIVASTGHSALDEATCDLVTKRARFEPARDSSGNKTTGDYSTSVKWQLPR